VLYVIDESIRGSNLSLNGYSRPTTPFLQELETHGRLVNLGICAGVSTYSHIANAYLVSGHNELPDEAYRTDKNPTIFDYAKKMGYRTVFIDVNHSYLSTRADEQGDRFIRSVDVWLRDEDLERSNVDIDHKYDLAVAEYMSDLLNSGGGYFILINKKGVHFQYRNRYPDDPAHQIWRPVMERWERIDPSPAGRERLVNTYDNGLRFAVDDFFRTLIARTRNEDFVILYTSDHGQTLSEAGQLYTHAAPDKVILDVPFFFVVGGEYTSRALIDRVRKGVRVSHLNNFSTLLDLMGVPPLVRIRPYEKSVFELTPQDNQVRRYLSGTLNGSRHGAGSNYYLGEITTPPEEGWGKSTPPGKPIPAR